MLRDRNEKVRIIICLLLIFSFQTIGFTQTTYIVNSVEDFEDVDLSDKKCADKNGNCTLRAAIQNTNTSKLRDKIVFELDENKSKRIILQESLPGIIYPIEIYGVSDLARINPENGVILDGNEIQSDFVKNMYSIEKRAGLYFSDQSNGSIINGLIFQSFESMALYIDSENNTIQNNVFGSFNGNLNEGNSCGLYVYGGNNLIGGLLEYEQNYFLGNLSGLVIQENDNNRIIGNEIGYYSQDNCIAKNSKGIEIHSFATNTLVFGNLISGNIIGISLDGRGSKIFNNLIGTDKLGENIIGNHTGVLVNFNCFDSFIGKEGLGNLISGNEVGIIIDRMRGSVATGKQIRDRTLNIEIQSNIIGTDKTGKYSLGNQYGVVVKNTGGVIIGGVNSNEANLISGNEKVGILLQDCFETLIVGNLVGVKNFSKSDLISTTAIFLSAVTKKSESANIIIRNNQIESNGETGIFVGEDWESVSILGNTISGSKNFRSSSQTGIGIGLKNYSQSMCFVEEDTLMKNSILFHKYGIVSANAQPPLNHFELDFDFQQNQQDYGIDPNSLQVTENGPHLFPSYEKLVWEELISFYLVREYFYEGELELYQNYLASIPD